MIRRGHKRTIVAIAHKVNGGCIRERSTKRGKRKKGLKRPGYSTKWFEPRLLTINQFDENGEKCRLKQFMPK